MPPSATMPTINCYHCLTYGDEIPISINSCSNADGKITIEFRCNGCTTKWVTSIDAAQIKQPAGVLRSGDLIVGGYLKNPPAPPA